MLQLFKQYRGHITALIALIFAANAVGLLLPRIVGIVIDAIAMKSSYSLYLWWLFAISAIAGLFILAQGIVSANISERVAFDLRTSLIKSLAKKPYTYVGKITPEELVTRITSDVDAVKQVVSQGIPSVVMALVLLVGSAIMLMSIHLKLALISLTLMPFMIGAFGFIFGKAGALFGASQQNLGAINKVMSESIVGAMLIRVLNAASWEDRKFQTVNESAERIGSNIVKLFSMLIPIVTLIANIATLAILWFGGTWAMQGSVTVGELSGFLSYYQLMIMPVFILGFVGGIIARGKVSLGRIQQVLQDGTATQEHQGDIEATIQGRIECTDVSLQYGAKTVLNKVSFTIQPGTKTAILGPTGAGKTQILMLLAGLLPPTTGTITIDERPIESYSQQSLHNQVGIVFQESIVFQASLRENIQFKSDISEQMMQKAIRVSALEDVVKTVQNGLETHLSERGNNLSGGQKQRLMLARALALNPKVLLLDDFTARVDTRTESQIQKALEQEYPNITLISITQKIQPIQNYDQIIFVMEGEILGIGTHAELLEASADYAQMYASQQSTESYE